MIMFQTLILIVCIHSELNAYPCFSIAGNKVFFFNQKEAICWFVDLYAILNMAKKCKAWE